MASEPFP